jgi:hypothetical protein
MSMFCRSMRPHSGRTNITLQGERTHTSRSTPLAICVAAPPIIATFVGCCRQNVHPFCNIGSGEGHFGSAIGLPFSLLWSLGSRALSLSLTLRHTGVHAITPKMRDEKRSLYNNSWGVSKGKYTEAVDPLRSTIYVHDEAR